MMSDDYSLPSRKARICRIAGTIFLLFALYTAVGVVGAAAFPGTKIHCKQPNGCTWIARPAELLDDDERVPVVASPAIERTFEAYVARPIVRLALAGVTTIEDGPFAIVLLGIGLALRRLGASDGDPLSRALPWLRRASLAAIVWALAGPLGDSLLASLLSYGTPEGPHWFIKINLGEIGTALLLAIAAYATMWALEAGLKAQRDLAEIV